MPRGSDEEDEAAPPEPCFSTPTKADCNDGAEPDAEGTESESDANVEKQFDKLTGKTRKYSAYLNYTELVVHRKRFRDGGCANQS